MEALRFVKRVTDDTLILPMPPSYKEQEVEVVVTIKEKKRELTTEEKLAILKRYEGIFANSEWQPGPDFEDEMYLQE
jgi:hypothetical protein